MNGRLTKKRKSTNQMERERSTCSGAASSSRGIVMRYLFHREYQYRGTRLRSGCKTDAISQSHSAKRKRSAMNRYNTTQLENQVKSLLEYKAASKGNIERDCALKGAPKTTFIVAFSSDSRRMATLHGDHTIRIIDIATGRNHQTLVGHPRSPWTVEFHKTHPNILASGCLGGQVRIWDLSSGDCDIWLSPTQHTITSLALHPTAKILLIAEAHHVYIWNWETTAEPTLFASSKKPCEKVRWIKFGYTGDEFYTGITASAEFDSWNILRQVPSAYELNLQRQRSARTLTQYQASLNATVSLAEMLGNPLEISNDLLAQTGSDNTNMDVYHAATTFAQLHRIHTGDAEDRSPEPSETTNASNFLSNGRQASDDTSTQTRQSQDSAIQSSTRQATSIFQQLSAPVAAISNTVSRSPSLLSLVTEVSFEQDSHGSPQPATATQPSEDNAGGSNAQSPVNEAAEEQSTVGSQQTENQADDTVFGISLRRSLLSTQPAMICDSRARSLATARPPIHRPSSRPSAFEPSEAVEMALQAQQNSGMAIWSEVLKYIGRLEGVRGPRRFSYSVDEIVNRLERFREITERDGRFEVDSARLRLLKQLHTSLQGAFRRAMQSQSQPSEDLRERLRTISARLEDLFNRNNETRMPDSLDLVATSAMSSVSSETSTDSISSSSSSTNLSSLSAETPAHRPDTTDSSTNTEPTLTRSFGVSTDDMRPSGVGTSELSSRSQSDYILIGRSVSSSRSSERPHSSSRQQSQALADRGIELRAVGGGPNQMMRLGDGPIIRVMNDSIHSSMNRPQRIQRWWLDEQVNDLDSHDNVLIHRCKIHNDAGIDISQDGTMLAVLVKNPNTANCPGIYRGVLPDTMLRLISLRQGSLGNVLHQIALVANPVSVSISPLNGYVVVGLAGWRNNTEHPMIKYDIYKLPAETGARLKLVQAVFKNRSDVPMATVNCAKWLPMPGQGTVIGTNQGNVIINHNRSAGNTSTGPCNHAYGSRRGLFIH